MVTDYGLSIEGRTADDLRRSCSVLFSVISLSSRLNIFLAKQRQNLLKLLEIGSRHTHSFSKMH